MRIKQVSVFHYIDTDTDQKPMRFKCHLNKDKKNKNKVMTFLKYKCNVEEK